MKKDRFDNFLKEYRYIGKLAMKALQWYNKNIQKISDYCDLEFIGIVDGCLFYLGHCGCHGEYYTAEFNIESQVLYDKNYRLHLKEEIVIKKNREREEREKREKEVEEKKLLQERGEYLRLKAKFEGEQ